MPEEQARIKRDYTEKWILTGTLSIGAKPNP
jgi:hypothetical protein